MSDETKGTVETGSEDNSNPSERQQQIVDMGSSTIKTERGTIHTLTIVGQIEGHQILPPSAKTTKYEHVMPLLAAIEESDEVDGLLVLLNTVGGDIEAGLGIAELIASMSKPAASLVLGGAISIVTILGYTAIAGTVGAGGLGDIAVRYGHQRFITSVMWVTVVILIILVQVVQSLFGWFSKRIDKRLDAGTKKPGTFDLLSRLAHTK